MRSTILFGGLNKERLVSVASTKAVNATMPEADLWFWDIDGTVSEADAKALQAHARHYSPVGLCSKQHSNKKQYRPSKLVCIAFLRRHPCAANGKSLFKGNHFIRFVADDLGFIKLVDDRLVFCTRNKQNGAFLIG